VIRRSDGAGHDPEHSGSHAIYVSQPQAVAALIEKAAEGMRAAA